MRTTTTTAFAVAAVAALGVAPVLAESSGRGVLDDAMALGRSTDVVALADDTYGAQHLLSLRTNNPERVRGAAAVTGLAGDARLVGIDHRVQDGRLYGVGDAGGLYTLDAASGAAAKVAQLSVALTGTSFGVDFNPAANALRIVSDTGQNLRQPLANLGSAAPVGATVVDGPLNGAATSGVAAVAYTNNDLDPGTAATLFGLATAQDQVVVQSPANAGTLATTGILGADAGSTAGFDIAAPVRSGSGVAQRALAVLHVAGTDGLYEVDILTGAASSLGGFAHGYTVTDLAIPLTSG